jgi:methionyl aminopeptidase
LPFGALIEKAIMGYFSGSSGKNVFYKTSEEVEIIRTACLLVCKTLAHVGSILKPGVTGLQIDKAAEEFVRDHGARPAFKGYGPEENPFPGTLCVSYNDIVVHGIPGDRPFLETDIVSVDCGVELNGYYGDAAYTFAMNDVAPETIELLRVTYASLYQGIKNAVVGNRVEDISFAIQDYTERKHKYGVVRELVGHGLGKSLHEDPQVPNYGRRGKGMVMRDGLVLAIEPMINQKTKDVFQENDGWTIRTRDGKPSAHYEHSVVVRKGQADILSNHEFILDAIKNNSEMQIILPKS